MEGVRKDELFSEEFLEEPAVFSKLEHFEAEEDLDDILDLAGGARDAIERHRSQNHDMDMEHEEEASAAAAEPHSGCTAAAQCEEPSSVWDLLYWTDVQKSVCVCGATLLLLISLSVFSVISVCSYIALVLLSVTISYRVYSAVTGALRNHQHTHPFRLYLEQEVVLSADDVHKHSAVVLKHINAALAEVKRLYLVEDLIDSLKLAVLLWILTYVGSVFNALTLLIIGDVLAFTCPVLYKKRKTQIDGYRDLIISHIKDLVKKIQMKVNRVKNKAE